MNIHDVLQKIEKDEFLPAFRTLYGSSKSSLDYQKSRYYEAVRKFMQLYPDREDVKLFSAPGRTEIGGNHTDHQHGCVLAAAVNLDVIAVVSFHDDKVIRVKSEGYSEDIISLSDLRVQPEESGSAAIIRGIAARFSEMGVSVGGFDAYTTSDVLSGSGISSSAAFETLIGTIIDSYYNDSKAGAVEIAKIGQFAENVYFGKKSGLMDQMVSSVGGLVSIDFYDTENPEIQRFDFDFEEFSYCLCITDTKSSHADLSDDYDAIRSEMESVAKQYGKSWLRAVDEAAFCSDIPKLRESCTDRAILRAAHFFEENSRAKFEASALRDGNMEYFLELVKKSGHSSAELLQNHYSCKDPDAQAINLAIMMSRRVLGDKGAVRVHGGGFAGTIQAFVPLELADAYAEEMNRLFGEHACQRLRIRPVGGVEITKEEM